MVNEQPNVKENGRYSITQAVKVLGISRGTMYKAIALGARCGGIDYRVRRDNGRKEITGREILRFWRG